MLAQDILGKVNWDFEAPDDAALALSVLQDFAEQNRKLASDRILRCIIFVAKGDLDVLDKAIGLAKTDYRDLIVWAEYDEKYERVRDLSTPFSR
ncbi:MAG: hypothetical protein JSW04_04515 [Desulfobacterales bacterium]|nr:MAG: hypothetical protein JSW04_04515 [Desulfobacterales bacterium]